MLLPEHHDMVPISYETVQAPFTQCSARNASHTTAKRCSGGDLQFEGFHLAVLVLDNATRAAVGFVCRGSSVVAVGVLNGMFVSLYALKV